MKFAQLFDQNSPVFNVSGYPSTLFPANFPEEIAAQIKSEFQDYDIALSPPWRWVERFHLTIERHLYQWEKLLASERYLRDEDGIYNYDLTEKSEFNGKSATDTRQSNNGQQYVSDTPDGNLVDIENYMSSGSRDQNSGRGESTSANESVSSLRRYGNIGVMTSAQILGGYRDAIDFDAYKAIFRDLESLFIGSFDLDDNGSFDLVVNPTI